MDEKKEALAVIVGKENILDDEKSLKPYSSDESFARPMKPWFVVKPKSADEIQGIVKWANDSGTPLVPLSSGPPHFRGDTVPSVPGSVVVDLSNMKKIVRIDRRNRMALIEPGVTYQELQPELAKNGLSLSMPLLPRSNKSVIASLLEREPRLVTKYQWAILDPLRCLEVVWGDGQKMTTGEAKSMGSLEEEWRQHQAQINSRGPGQIDFYKLVSAAQGSMGIVAWASIKCEVLPELHKLFFVSSRRINDLIDFSYRVLRFRFGDEILLLNSSTLSSCLAQGQDGICSLRRKLPPWVALIGVAGRDRLPRERVEFLEKDISDIAQQFGLELMPAIEGVRTGDVLKAVLGVSPEPYWKLSHKGGCQDIFFVTTLDKTPDFIELMYGVAEREGYPSSDIGVYIQPIHQGASCHCEFNLPYNPKSDREASLMRELYTKASEELLKHGAYFSRPYGIWADMAFNRDAQTTILLKKIKGIFDPNNIMNPGKLCF